MSVHSSEKLKNRRILKIPEPKEKVLAWLLVTPGLIVIFGLNLYPIAYSFWLSLHEMSLLNPESPFVGLKNYVEILSNNAFWISALRTLYFVVVSLILQLIIGLLIALVLNKPFWGRGFVRALILIPWAIPTVVNGVLWEWILNANYGALNGILHQLGIIDQYINWLGEPLTALNMVILADTWKMTPFYVLLFLAGLQTISRELYEASNIDGAGLWKQFIHITVPPLKPVILVILVLRTMQAFRVFDIIYILTKGGPAGGTTVISFYAYQESFGNLNFGYGSAISFVIALMILLMALAYIKLLNTEEAY